MGLINFFKRKFSAKSIAEVVAEINDIKKEFAKAIEKQTVEITKLKEEIKQKEIELQKSKIIIKHVPNKSLVVVINGEVLESEDVSIEAFQKLVKLREENDVLGIFEFFKIKNTTIEKAEQNLVELEKEMEKSQKEIEEIETTTKASLALIETGLFEEEEMKVYLKGVKRSIPPFLISRMNSLYQSGKMDLFNALLNMWRWLVLNPNARAVEDFFPQVDKFKPVITKEGFILAYRWVQSVNKSKSSSHFKIEDISNLFINVRKKQKKNPRNFDVFELKDGVYKLGKVGSTNVEGKKIGNLFELYEKIGSLDSEQTYTDGYTKTMDIRIGKPVKMKRKDCDESTNSCSQGLHACFNLKDHSSNGDTKILVAICPRNIVSAPYSSSKFRSCEYLPLAVLKNNQDESNFLKSEEGLNLLEDYFKLKTEELKEQAEKATVKELQSFKILPENIQLIKIEETAEETLKGQTSTLAEAFESQLSRRIKTIK